MDFEPAQGGGVAGQGSCVELGRGDGQLGVRQGLVSGLDTGVGHARAGTQESLRVALGGSGVFLVVQKLTLCVDERAGLDELGQ